MVTGIVCGMQQFSHNRLQQNNDVITNKRSDVVTRNTFKPRQLGSHLIFFETVSRKLWPPLEGAGVLPFHPNYHPDIVSLQYYPKFPGWNF